MSVLPPMLAELDETDQLLLKNLAHSGSTQAEIIFGSIAAVTVLLFLFVYVFRKRILRRRKHRHHHRPAPNDAAATTADAETKPKRKWRRLRRHHRPINPTLAETHGLPPLREEGNTPTQPPVP